MILSSVKETQPRVWKTVESVSRDKKRINSAFQSSALKILSEFGPSVKTAVLYHITRLQGKTSVEEALCDPIQFSAALETIFSQGAVVIEDKIIEAICVNLGFEYERTKGTFDEKLSRIYDLAYNSRDPRLMVKIGALEQTMNRVI